MTGLEPLSVQGSAATEAVAWFAKSRSGRLTAAETAKLDQWLEEPANAAALLSVTAHWRALERLRDHPGILEVRDRARRSMRQSMQRRASWRLASAAAIAALVVASIFTVHEAIKARGTPTTYTQFAATRGERLPVALEDGSSLILDADSRVRVTIGSKARRVELAAGRAFFKVKKDRSRPFIVVADGHSVTALGTSFTVGVAGGALDVVLVEGRVRVAQGSRSGPRAVDMITGQRLTVRNERDWILSKADVRESIAWTQGRLLFADARIADVAAELNRYSSVQVRIADKATAEKRVGVVLNAGDVGTFVDAVEGAGLAHARRDPDGGITLHQ